MRHPAAPAQSRSEGFTAEISKPTAKHVCHLQKNPGPCRACCLTTSTRQTSFERMPPETDRDKEVEKMCACRSERSGSAHGRVDNGTWRPGCRPHPGASRQACIGRTRQRPQFARARPPGPPSGPRSARPRRPVQQRKSLIHNPHITLCFHHVQI